MVGESLASVRQKIELGQQAVLDTIAQIKRLKRASDQKQEWVQKKLDAEFKLRFYQQHAVEDKLQKQIDFDRDERKAGQVILTVHNYLNQLIELIASFEDELKNHTFYHSTNNQAFFTDFFALFATILQGLEIIKQISNQGQPTIITLREKAELLKLTKQSLKEEFAEIERKLAGELQQVGAQAISPQEFLQLKNLLDQAEQMLNVLEKSEQQYAELNNSLAVELAKLNDLWLEEYRLIEQIVISINNIDSPLKIIPAFKANKTAMLKYLQDLFRGSRIREAALQNIINEYSDFAAIWRDMTQVNQYLGGSVETFSQYFENNLEALLTWQVPNVFSIEYHGKALAHHSLGQRASALILFVLSQRDNDVVIIDQPEDDLDNQTIYDDVIKLIRALKPNTQFIFATHNANIPVLGDAEQVIVCRYLDERISTVSGSIDCVDIKKYIVNIMEGGAEAFERRKQVYEAWK